MQSIAPVLGCGERQPPMNLKAKYDCDWWRREGGNLAAASE